MNCSEVILFSSISFWINSSIRYVCLAIDLAESLSLASFIYSSLKVNIAEGSIPIHGVSSVIKFLKVETFLFAKSFASFKNPFDR